MGESELEPTEVDAEIDRLVEVEDVSLVHADERFDRIGVLGKGGMGEVRLYRDRRIARFVAYKVLHKSIESNPAARSRFLLEARVQGQLEHPAIVPVHDLGETEDGELYFSMKCVRGVTLRQALARKGQAEYSLRRLLSAFSSVCLAVDFAHSRGVVHRDLKPQNVMLGHFGEVYVLDWGIAKVMHGADTPTAETIEALPDTGDTQAGSTLGTPKYMAPERQYGVANPSTDVYALGVILGEILHRETEIAPELDLIYMHATALNAGDRYQTARALHDALEQYLDGNRDLEARRKLAEQHATLAEAALLKGETGRADAGHELGRALGLDPSNPRAMRTLMRLLTEMPATLPAGAQAALDQHRRQRRQRVLGVTTIATSFLFGTIPMILAMGVIDWRLFTAFLVAVFAAVACQFVAARSQAKWPFILSPVVGLAAIGIQTTSLGLLGVVPAALAIMALAWRMQVVRALHGVLIVLAAMTTVVAPFVLVELGLLSPMYEIRDGVLVLMPNMHAFPRAATLATIILSTAGALGVAVIYGRLYTNELRRAEERVHFHAWQLQQLVPQQVEL